LRVVILGTGTDVGKTYVTACLARGLRDRGCESLIALKPIESGVAPGAAGDAGTIADAAGHPARLSAWRFGAPVSPHLAARREDVEVDPGEVVGWVRTEESKAGADISLVELAGGAFTPLRPGTTNVDLASALEPAVWLLVAPDSLGVLHDLTATLRALPRAPDAVLLSEARAADASSGSNAGELAKLGIAQVLEVIARGARSSDAAAEWLLRHPTYTSPHK
jgi:dethiobiotin synthetase